MQTHAEAKMPTGPSRINEDPILSVIERHRICVGAHAAAVDQADLIGPIPPKLTRSVNRASAALDKTAIALATTQPTTLTGVVALLSYLGTQGGPDLIWPPHPRQGMEYATLCYQTLAKAMEAIDRKRASRNMH